jgi:integrase
MKRQFRFTKRSLDALPPCPANSASKEVEWSDLDIGGLRVQVNRQGRKSFLFRYQIHGRKRAMKAGGYPETSIEEARQKAIEWKALLAKGIDPQEERDALRETGITFREFFEQYLGRTSSARSAAPGRTKPLPQSRAAAFGHREMTKITTLELQRFHNDNKAKMAPASSNRIFELIRHAYTLAGSWSLIPPTVRPCDGIRLHRENNKRERFIEPGSELPRLLKALDAEPSKSAADLFRFLLATGARRAEAMYAKWEHIRAERQQWYLPTSKSGKARIVILNEVAMEILNGGRASAATVHLHRDAARQPIGNPTRAWQRVLRRAGIDPKSTRIHDLRHSHGSYLVGVASLQEIGGILGTPKARRPSRPAMPTSTMSA